MMRGLFTKIFLCFWIAQSLTVVISTILILQHHFVRPDQTMDAFDASLAAEAASTARVYEQQGCSGVEQYANTIHQTIYLANAAQQLQCVSAETSYASILGRSSTTPNIQSAQIGEHYVWSKAVTSAGGQKYIFLLVRPTRQRPEGLVGDLWHFAFPQLPVTIVVFGASTFILVLMLTRPIARLRAAAGDLAKGELSARVSQTDSRGGLFGGDEIQELAHDFNYMAERLESLVGAQRMLLRDVSHELRTPLTRLCVTLELAREDAPQYMMDHLERIERESACLTTLIEQLLRLSSMESANTLVHTERFSFAKLLDEIVPNAGFEASRRSCSVQLQGTCDCEIEGVPTLLHQAVENVVRNAIRYTREGSIVEMNLRREGLSGQEMMVLDICDDGPGIPEDEMESIFLPFYRVDGARQRDTGGFGVGLAIAERAVRLHRGEIIAQNRAAGGLMVTLKIPCTQGRLPIG
jgi:two-component system sensor histidine kinase CpxA